MSGLRKAASSLMDAVEVFPPVRALRKWDYESRRFPRWPNACLGVYSSFAEARAAAPPGEHVGFDHEGMTDLYDDRLDTVFPGDYPVLLWLQKVLRSSSKVFDFGGHVGISYYSFARYVDYPADLSWKVCDVPAIIERGRRLAAEKKQDRLSFTSNGAEADGADVFLGLGALQFVETPLTEMLRDMKRRPRHVILNKMPMLDGKQFVTLQNSARTYNPFQVYDREPFIAAVCAQGYELVDRWELADTFCKIPYHPGCSVDRYTGLYFKRRD